MNKEMELKLELKLVSGQGSSKIEHKIGEDIITLAWMQQEIDTFDLDSFVFERYRGDGWKRTHFSWLPLHRYSGERIDPEWRWKYHFR